MLQSLVQYKIFCLTWNGCYLCSYGRTGFSHLSLGIYVLPVLLIVNLKPVLAHLQEMHTVDGEIPWEAWQGTILQLCFHLLLPCCLTLGQHFMFGAPHLLNYRRESLAFLCKGLHWCPHTELSISQGALSGACQAAGRVTAVKLQTH